jgi:ribosomal protein S18 acetylase RimI-like enzyme
MNLMFATAVPAQLAEVADLIRAAFTPYIRALGREIEPGTPGWFVEAIEKGDIYVALDGSKIAGAIITRPHETDLELAMIGVSPARQKSGIASWMIGRIEEIARGRGLATLSLNTAEKMEDRVRLYTRHGFRIMRRGMPTHGKDAHVRVFMEKPLLLV